MESWILRVSKNRRIRDSMNIPKVEFIAYNYIFFYKYLKYKKNIFNLGIKTGLHLKYNHINGLVQVSNGKAEQPA